MKKLIYSSVQQQRINPGTWIKKVGKFLNDNIDGAFKIKFGAMNCEVWMKMYYQVPGRADTFEEMDFLIDITSYQNKLRVNLIEDTYDEKTVGHFVLKPEELTDLHKVKSDVLAKIQKYIAKEYADYDFIY